MDIKPIKNKRTTEIILDQMKQFLILGEWKSGDKLPTEMELAECFEVSRTSVREALAALHLTGILDVRQGGGIFVRQASSNAVIEPLSLLFSMEKDHLRNILEVRKALEVEAVGLAALRKNEENLNILEGIVGHMAEELRSASLDLQFHLELARASQNPLLDRLMNTVQDAISKTLDLTRALWLTASSGTVSQLFEQHQFIFQAVREGDEARARALMCDHLTKVENQWNKSYLVKKEEVK